MLNCLVFERQEVCRAFSRACANTGKRMAARIAMIAITTRSSISVNAREERRVMEGSSFKNRDECDTPHREWLPIRSPAARLIPVPESPRGGIVDPGSEQAVGRRLLPECGSLPHVGPVREAGCPPLALGMRNASALRQAL